MTMRLLGLGTALPARSMGQEALCAVAEPCSTSGARQRRLLPALYRRTGVRRRASVVDLSSFYPSPGNGAGDHGPSTGDRMARYQSDVVPLAGRACWAALEHSGVGMGEVVQLVAVSCTGFASPGLDLGLIETLGLRGTVGRTMLGFMGCHGALSGLRIAHALALAAPRRPVLMCCAELCTLHFQYGWDSQRIVSNALFADGAAACVGVADGRDDQGVRLIDSASLVLDGCADAMTWTIGDHGFEMTLSPRVPGLVEEHLGGFLGPWLASHDLTPSDVGGWAVHPGGPRVISAVEKAMGLPRSAGEASRAVLAGHGNMSSPTVLFILDRLRRADVPRPWVALAFGPGLTIEAALLR